MSEQLRFPKTKCEKYFQLDEDRKRHDRAAKAIKKQQEAIEAKLEEFTRASGNSAEKYGFKLYIKEQPGAVAWKQEFVKVSGNAAAEKLIAAQETKEVLVVDRAK